MQHRAEKAGSRRHTLWALALTTSMLVLSGCVSAGSQDKDTASLSPAATDAEVSATDTVAEGAMEDQQVVALGADGQPADGATANAMMPASTNGQPDSLVLQTNGLKATSSSIYASQVTGQTQMPGDTAMGTSEAAALPVLENQPGVKPVTNSLFQSKQQPAAEPMPLPLEGASNTTQAADPAQQIAVADTILPDNAAALEMPASVPLPLSGAAALQGETSGQLHAVQPSQQAAAMIVTADGQQTASLPISDKTETEEKDSKPAFSLAALFAGKRKNKTAFDGDRLGKATQKKTISQENVQQQQVASLAYNALPGVRATSMFATAGDAEPAHDDDSGTIEVASLPGLARLAPNGLWLQTQKVETGCFKPELMQVLKIVENHYGRKVMVTSGLRDLKHNRRAGGRRQSLHTTCEAADIQIPGISKWKLAEYLRTIPGRGGVGTYCHTESVHIDIGTERDWNWRCRRRKG
ncbi:D-Ala-D-Ala carboxypeptidase family metallohydrolase [Rhizobium sp. 32-5/1]|uniref:D-Ala-D-Ala carboxypeptidase family metallohydrolase n=1 Tax=Rhizobium sp. 32-5/1 TaxID=3019602 RepID=UPI00240D2B7B|nr:D-Ala-D-Ala carboxypeptidase family metallohydrolase [Rhizobium sp. 32-5/1]WEZ83545.1 D-Ala-D-Ala carboxypeptidase family metallohydrolase [Rhizobium sp. 32-5/1]